MRHMGEERKAWPGPIPHLCNLSIFPLTIYDETSEEEQMPLLPGKKNIGHNIKVEEAAGKPHEQAVAIALNKAATRKRGGVTSSRSKRRSLDRGQQGQIDSMYKWAKKGKK